MIRNFVDKNCQAIFKSPGLYLLVLIFLTGIFGYYYATLPSETSVESLIVEDDPDLRFYEQYKEQFGEDQFLVVAFSADDIFDSSILSYLDEQTVRLESLPEVDDVVSLSNVERFVGSDYDFMVEPLYNVLPANPSQENQVREQALDSSLIGGRLVNSTSTATLLLIRPIRSDDPRFDERLVDKVEALFASSASPYQGFAWHVAGWINTDVNMSRFMNRDMLVFMPMTFVLLVILVAFALRNVWAIVLSIANVGVCLVWALAFLNLIGGAMSPITSILPPLIMALAVSDSIHVFTVFLKQNRHDAAVTDTIRRTLVHLAVPCFLTSFTTAIGFASLAVSQVPPIRHFGLAAAGGMMAEFLLTMTLIPVGICFLRHKTGLKGPAKEKKVVLRRSLKRLSSQLVAHHSVVVWSSVVLIVLSIWAALSIEVETNLLSYFKANSAVSQASRFVDQQLGGVETIEISLMTPDADQLLEPQTLAIVEGIEQYLERQPIVSQVSSANDFFREMNKAFHNDDPRFFSLPQSRAMAAQYLLLYDGDELERFMDGERRWTRVSARITEHRSSVVAEYLHHLNVYLQQVAEPEGLTVRITGKTLMVNKLIHLIVNSQVQSLALALVLILLTTVFIFRSIRLGVIALIPNLIPILLNFAVMGVLGIPLNSATAIIAAVAIGIAVDDTIHFICNYQHLRQSGGTVAAAVEQTLVDKGHPIIITSLIMAGAFAILLFASFVPTIQFGFLCSLIMLFAVVADLIVLPAIFLKFESTL
ncbi:MMPL family transporter [Desulfuromonas acetoxidans]|uniref:efflux RND transporter permease subunit n=1 Tax=Desulfuromonas acetoxidans TaxID=891 RepID=UPI00292FEADD|nr:MMPL family transporter [Desulfuromonas acetoxidans]